MKRIVLSVAVILAICLPAGPSSAGAAVPVAGAATVGTAKAKLPTKAQWKRDVRKRMKGSGSYLRAALAAAGPGERLALNLDIDNSMMATFYQRGTPVGPTYDLVAKARRWGVTVLVNTARPVQNRAAAVRLLHRGGYRGAHAFDDICLRQPGETAPHGKQRCRAEYVSAGYRLVINVGNNRTDFVGGDYDRAYRLPNYGHRLG